MRVYSAILARNEAGPDRYFTRVVERCKSFSDRVLVLDDRSTDGTADLAASLGCAVAVRDELGSRAWGSEGAARRQLWELALTHATGWNDWVFIVDADHEVVGDVRGLCLSLETNAWSFALFDCWSPTQYRSDEFWRAHAHPRPWLFAPHRVPTGYVPTWSARGIHVGHCPANFPLIAGIAPPDTHHILHWGWSNPAHREVKYEQYMRQQHQLSPGELAHVESILQ